MFYTKQYNLPTLKDGAAAIKQKRAHLVARIKFLDPEELDWLDWADDALDRLERRRA